MTQAILTVGNIFADAFEGLMDLFRDMRIKAQKKALYRQTRAELSGLTDRELNDLGIGRSDIESIARGTFFKDAIVTKPNDNLKGWV